MKRVVFALLAGVTLACAATSAQAQATLTAVKARGYLQCGVSQGLPGFSSPDDKGNWTGLDVDLCRAVAAAIFDDATKVKFSPLSAKDRFAALQNNEVDLLSRNTTWTMNRDTALGLDFPAVLYYDGQGFIVRKTLKVASAMELSGASVCTQTGTTTELNAADFFRSNKMKYEVVAFATADEAVKAYDAGRCDVYTTDASGLYAMRLQLTKSDDHVILPEIISKEPLSPAVRHGDNNWGDIVRWVHAALLNAEEYGVTTANLDEMMKSDKPEVKRLLGVEGEFGSQMGLTNDWVVRIVKHVGNYGESFERNVGMGSKLQITRGLNALWSKGGLQFPAPVR